MDNNIVNISTEYMDRYEWLNKLQGVTVERSGTWLWISGDTYPHRDYLKSLGCRWSKKRKAWYYTGSGLTEKDETLSDFTTKTTDGYMGAVGFVGSKSDKYLYGSELSKAVRDDLRDYIKHPSIKRSDLNVKVHTFSMGQSIKVSVKLDRDLWAVPREQFINAIISAPHCCWHYDDFVYYRDDYDTVKTARYTSDLDQDIIRRAAEYKYECAVGGTRYDVNQYHIGEHGRDRALTDDCIQLLKDVNRIICAYRYDDSNVMVDYFDTNFYYDIAIVWK